MSPNRNSLIRFLAAAVSGTVALVVVLLLASGKYFSFMAAVQVPLAYIGVSAITGALLGFISGMRRESGSDAGTVLREMENRGVRDREKY